MSRSYRKPIATDGYGSKWKKKIKQQANKSARKDLNITDGNNYKKSYNSWDICDYKFDLPPTKKNRSK